MTFTCGYCDKTFSRESSIEVHMCEPKRRRLQRGDRGVQLGLQAYVRFYETMQGSAKNKTSDDFETSSYYRAFVKFGHYCVNTRVINPERFMAWLLKQQKKIDRWCSDQVYTEYLANYLTLEAVDDALARAMEYGLDWAEKTDNPAHDCLRYGNANAICHAITAGRVSPWVIYSSESGQKFLSELSSDQVSMIWLYIDSDVWQKKFQTYPADHEYAKEMLKQAGW
jgi:hypothetical protein